MEPVKLSYFLNEPPVYDWGPWRLDPDTYVLFWGDPRRYEVDLERCRTSAEVLDWICQVAGKQWSDDANLAGLVRAINDVLHPQASLCSWGASRRIAKTKIRQRVDSIADQVPL
jgi:hypothetical protein